MQYPFLPPFVQIVRPRFVRGTGNVIDGAICMELLTAQGWSPANSVESVIISIQAHLVVGKGRLDAAVKLGDERDEILKGLLLDEEEGKGNGSGSGSGEEGIDGTDGDDDDDDSDEKKVKNDPKNQKKKHLDGGVYSAAEARTTFQQIVKLHKERGWNSNWVKHG